MGRDEDIYHTLMQNGQIYIYIYIYINQIVHQAYICKTYICIASSHGLQHDDRYWGLCVKLAYCHSKRLQAGERRAVI